jgi:hypothetical protein
MKYMRKKFRRRIKYHGKADEEAWLSRPPTQSGKDLKGRL